MRILTTTQGTPEWIHARAGMVTASRMADVIDVLKRKEGESAKRRNYRMELITERLTGRVSDHYVSEDMEFGSEHEGQARTEYEIATRNSVDQVGLIGHPDLDFAAASPDGLIGTIGGFEAKCPKSTTHIAWTMAGTIPDKYLPQMMWGMACTGAEWWDFCSFDPRLPDNLQLFIKRLHRNEESIALLTVAVVQFESEIRAALASLGKPPDYWAREAPVPPIGSTEGFLDDRDLDQIYKGK